MKLMKFARLVLCACALFVVNAIVPAFAEVEPNMEAHRIIGGLYSLAAAANLNGGEIASVTVKQLEKYFVKDAARWLANVKTKRQGSTLWVGVPVDKFSTARRILRNRADELKITDTPGGGSWFSGDYAWLAVTPEMSLKAARGAALDSGVLFLSIDGTEFWWQSVPALNPNAASAALKRWGINEPGLHVPTEDGSEKFKASPVGLPEEFHTTAKPDPFAIDIGGDVTFNPIPNMNVD